MEFVPTPLKLAAARYLASDKRAYLATAILSMIPVAREGIGTLGVDEYWRLYYDPQVIEEWSVEHITGVLIHEVGHLLQEHSERFKLMGVDDFYKAKLANIAGDMAINCNLVKEDLNFPSPPVVPSMINMEDGLLAEEYYSEILKHGPQVPSITGNSPGQGDSSQDGDQTDGSGSKSGSSAGKSKSNPKSGTGSPNKSAGTTKKLAPGELPPDLDTDTPGSGNCGSCAHGMPMPWEEPAPGEGTDVHGIGKMEGELIRRDVARRIIESTNDRGTIPAGWKRWAELKLKPVVDWRKQLSAVVRATLTDISGGVDFSRSKPSRRQSVYKDIVMPSLRQPNPKISVLLDTSGSMNDDRLSKAMTEISGILRNLGQREGVKVFSCDAIVHAARVAFRMKDVLPLGGGGTDMRVGIEAAMKERPKPHCLIILTDCETPWPERAPEGVKVIIGKVGRGDTPDWAKVIDIDLKKD